MGIEASIPAPIITLRYVTLIHVPAIEEQGNGVLMI